jgi:hypothetical protein
LYFLIFEKVTDVTRKNPEFCDCDPGGISSSARFYSSLLPFLPILERVTRRERRETEREERDREERLRYETHVDYNFGSSSAVLVSIAGDRRSRRRWLYRWREILAGVRWVAREHIFSLLSLWPLHPLPVLWEGFFFLQSLISFSDIITPFMVPSSPGCVISLLVIFCFRKFCWTGLEWIVNEVL